MLAMFRKFANTIVGKLLIGVLTAGMSLWGISNIITHLGSTTVASLAGTDITTRDFQRAYQQQLGNFSRQLGITPTVEQALSFGLPTQVLRQLSTNIALAKLGDDFGLGVSDDQLGAMVRDDPTFGNALGQFDQASFKQILAQAGFTEREYFDLQRDAAARKQIVSGLFGGMPAPQVANDILARYTGDTRTISYITLNAQSLPSIPTPTDAELEAYLKANQPSFRTQETRKVEVMVLSPESIASAKVISDADIAAEYDRTKDRLVKPERRAIKQIVLSTPELEKAFVDGKAAATPLATLIATTGATEDDLGTKAKAEISDQSLADAAFGLSKDDYVIIDGIGAKRAITVTNIEAGGQQSLADVKDSIARTLALKEARDEFGDLLDQVEELRAARKPVSEIAPRFQISPKTLDLTPGGPELVGIEDIPEDYRAKVADAIFKADQGELGAGISLGANRTVWFDLTSVALAHDQTLAEARDAVTMAWTNQKTEELIKAEADSVLADVKGGKSFDDALTAIGQIGQLSQPLRRSGDGTTLLDANVAREVFNGGADHYGTVVNGDGDHVVFQVVDVTAATDAPTADIRTFTEEGIRETAFQALSTDVTSDYPMNINQQLLMQLVTSTSAQ
jgi:peptidyl-prolyl cis-trans isomerase D